MMKYGTLTLTVSILMFGGMLALLQSQNAQAVRDTSKSQELEKPVLKEVSTISLQPTSIADRYELPGRITAYKQSVVRPQVDGIIVERLFEQGSVVSKGQQLYQIDATRYNAVLNSANANLVSIQSQLASIEARAKRYRDLSSSNAISRQDFDDAEAEYKSALASIAVAKAEQQLAQIDVDYTRVYAPISGRISRSRVTEGALVTANQAQELATITQLDPIYVDMQYAGNDPRLSSLSSLMAQGERFPVTVYAAKNTKGEVNAMQGALKLAEVTMDETTASTTLRAEIPNPDGWLRPGMYVRAEINLGEKMAFVVPQRATTRTPRGTLSIMLVDGEGNVEQRIISEVSQLENQWVVLDGLNKDDSLIVEGYQKVAPGEKVKTLPWNGHNQPHKPMDIGTSL